jgi:hypothetical protein
MRAGPLSDPKVVELLNAYFVPVYISNEEYEQGGSAPAAEKLERNRIWHEAHQKKLSSGTVHVYLLTPDGDVFNSLHVAHAIEKNNLRTALENAIANRKLTPGKPLIPPALQSTAPKHSADDAVLHVVARGSGHGSWREFPGEDWIVLSKREQAAFGDKADADIPAEIARKILTYFYPQTENNNASPSRIEEASLRKAKMKSADGVTAFRLEGKVRLKHAFYPHKPDNSEVVAPVLGWVEYDSGQKKIISFRLATDDAHYGKEAIEVVAKLAEKP